MNTYKRYIVNSEGEKYETFSTEEIAQRQIDEQKAIQDEQEYLAKEQAKIDAKASALAKLSALGLTEEEVQAIIK